MQAKDVMTTKVVTAKPETSIKEIAKLLLDRRIGAVPITKADGTVVGMVSESDLMRRPEMGTERPSSWWLQLVQEPSDQALAYVKSHGLYAKDVMTLNVTTVQEDTPLAEIAELLDSRGFKRGPVMRKGKLVGIISRADLLRGLAASKPAKTLSTDDQALREAAEAAINKHAGLDAIFVSTVVTNRKARIWGGVERQEIKNAIRVAVENVPGIEAVEDNINVFPAVVRAVFWAE